MSGITKNTTIDYLTVTWKGRFEFLFGESKWDNTRPLFGYESGLVTNIGLYCRGDNAQGNICVLSGLSMRVLREKAGMNDLQILKHVVTRKVTRIDLAVDIFDSHLSAKGLERMYVERQINPRSRQATIIADTNGERGDTFYLGSLKSRTRLFRGYEKSKQEKSFLNQFRLELQSNKDGGSDTLAKNLSSENETLADLQYDIEGAIVDFLKPSRGCYLLECLDGNYKLPRVIDRHKNKTQKWLYEKVLPTLKREMDRDIDFANKVAELLNSPPY